jgi:hypothetical protein
MSAENCRKRLDEEYFGFNNKITTLISKILEDMEPEVHIDVLKWSYESTGDDICNATGEECHRFTDCKHFNDKFTLEQNQKHFKKQDRKKDSKTKTA